MTNLCRTFEFDEKGLAPGDNQGPVLHQPFIPERQLRIHGGRVGIGSLVAQVAQQAVALRHHLLIGSE